MRSVLGVGGIELIKVCDSIMGSGKSQSAITYMNEHTEENFIYITPYLPESKRIKEGCPDRRFIEPSDEIKDFEFSKLLHTHHLLKNKRNITSTHKLFSLYTAETLDLIRDNHYTLIIDEDVEAFTEADVCEGDVELLVKAGYVATGESGAMYKLVNDSYRGKALGDVFRMLRSHELVKLTEDGKTKYYYWVFPMDLLNAFEDVVIMTYMFDCQDLKYYLDHCKLDYRRIGIACAEDSGYRFTDDGGYIPEYVKYIRDKIHILDDAKLNAVGDNYYALSMNWFGKHKTETEILQKNIYNYFRNRFSDVPLEKKMWGTYKKAKAQLRGKGYTNSYVVFNQKATNEHRTRKVLAYCSNVFMPRCKKDYIHSLGLKVDQDAYALSTLLQWIWRSAIRDGEEIDLYIPSRRMRELLIGWMNEVSNGGNQCD